MTDRNSLMVQRSTYLHKVSSVPSLGNFPVRVASHPVSAVSCFEAYRSQPSPAHQHGIRKRLEGWVEDILCHLPEDPVEFLQSRLEAEIRSREALVNGEVRPKLH